jgi:hypothetical protein
MDRSEAVAVNQEYILVSAPTKAGENFIKELIVHRVPFVVIANNKTEVERLKGLGANHIIMIDSTEAKTWILPDFTVGKVFLFERSLSLCCRYIQICRSWTSKEIFVVTKHHNPRLVYKGLGATTSVHTTSDDVSFLVSSLVG